MFQGKFGVARVRLQILQGFGQNLAMANRRELLGRKGRNPSGSVDEGGGEPGDDFSARNTANVVALTVAPNGRSHPSKQAGSPERAAKDPRNKYQLGRVGGRLGGRWRTNDGMDRDCAGGVAYFAGI